MTLSEEAIERDVERAFNRLDARLMRNELTQEQYDQEAKKISASAEQKYAELRAQRKEQAHG